MNGAILKSKIGPMMSKFARGDIVLVNLEPTIGNEQQGKGRPCLIVSSNDINEVAPIVIVCPISKSKPGKIRRYGVVTVLVNEGGLNFESDILTTQIRTVDLTRIQNVIGQLSHLHMVRVDLSLRTTLDLD